MLRNLDENAVNAVNATLQTSLAGEEPDPSLARTTECLMNLQEAEQARKNRSKLAEMAEANRSCTGIMSGNGQEEGRQGPL